MKKFSLVLLVCMFFSLPLYGAGKASKRQYRKFVLKNGLKVLLVSDPGVNISSASMDVTIGSLADPPNRQGLAHFLEHMLFLATKKYPKLNDYGKFLKSRGGYSNAFTASDQTNYHFQVNHDGLPEALDRFGHFFIDPILDFKYAKREVMAVNSEHQKNIPKDTWRLMQLQRSLLKKGHPASLFHTGSIKTLKGTGEKELRKFMNSYYSPSKMALCVISPLSLDKQEELVKKIFSQIPARKALKFKVSSHLLDIKKTVRLVKAVPMTDISQLKLYFPLAPQYKNIGSKSGKLIGMTMGDEGKGSLLSYLKKQGLAISLSAGIGNESRFFSSCGVTVGLTQKGLKEYKKVLKLCMAYIEMLKKSPFPRHIWKEMKTSADLQKRYSPKGEGTAVAISLAHNANLYGLKIAEKVNSYFTAPDEKNYYKILAHLNPSNMLVMVVGKKFAKEANQTERWYGSKYSYQEDSKLYGELQKLSWPAEIHLPLPNPFIPKNIDLVSERPVRVIKNPYVTIWYSQDLEFHRPKAAISLHILTPQAYKNLKQVVLLQLYTKMIKEKLNEYAYPALTAGMTYSLSGTKKGVFLSVTGYSDSAMSLLKILGKELTNQKFSPQVFSTLKRKMLRGIKNFPFSPAYAISREISRKINLRRYYRPAEIVPILKTLTIKDLQNFVAKLYRRTHIQALGHGNLTAPQLIGAVVELSKSLKSRPFSPWRSYEDVALLLNEGDDLTYKETLKSNNSCLRMEYQVGMADLQTQAATWIIARAMRNGFYTEMRTKQMLGYIVFSGSYVRQNLMNLVFIIQSSNHSARDLFNRADKYLATLPSQFERLPDRYFEAIRTSLIKDRQKKAKSIAAKANLFYYLAFQKQGNFDQLQDEIQALKQVKNAEVLALVQKTFAKKTRKRLSLLLNAKQHPKDTIPATIKDIEAFHKQRVFDEFPRITRRLLLGQ